MQSKVTKKTPSRLGELISFTENFCCKISSNCIRKMPQIHHELSNSLKFCRFWCNSVHFPKDFVPISNTISSTMREWPMLYIFGRERCSVLLQKHFRNHSKNSQKFNIFFVASCVLFESFWSQKDGKRSTKTELIPGRLLKKYCRIRLENCSQSTANSKMSIFLSAFDLFSECSYEIGKFRLKEVSKSSTWWN